MLTPSLARLGTFSLDRASYHPHSHTLRKMLAIRLLKRLRAEPAPIRMVASRVLWHTPLARAITIQRPGYRIRFHPSAVSAETWHLPKLISAEERFVARTLKSGDTYVDVGANVGLLALRAASIVGPTGRVIAIEAHPATFSYLQDNIRLNGFGITAIHAAAGDANGVIRFSSGRSDDQNHVVIDSEEGIDVAVKRLDEMVPPGPITLLKVDVEGFELPVFLGAPAVLSRTRTIMFESWDQHVVRYDYRVADILKLLRDAGFRITRLHEDHELPIAGEHTSVHCENLIAHR